MERKLELGDVLIHRNVLSRISNKDLECILERQRNCDWGDVGWEEQSLNDAALKSNKRIVSAFCFAEGEVLMLITEGNRRLTVATLPDDYQRTYLSFMQLKDAKTQE
jgi:hypothetical protein